MHRTDRRLRTALAFLLCLVCAGALAQQAEPNAPPAATPTGRIVLHTSMGAIVLTLDTERAPASSANFLEYVSSGFYAGTVFHRVIDGFMIQGGGFTDEMTQKSTSESIRNEAANGLLNVRGTIAMARTSNPHSATSQFFINLVDNDFLNHRGETARGWGYAVFGRVVEGMDVVDRIARVATGRVGRFSDVPRVPVVIERAEIEMTAPE